MITMLEENKPKSIEYWNKMAQEWKNKAHDPSARSFPTSQVRQDLTIREILRMNMIPNPRMIDLGCATGELVRSLVRKGFIKAKGIDNSPQMIEKAKNRLGEEFPALNPDDYFVVADADTLPLGERYDYVIAMGLIEYVKDIKKFFKLLASLLAPQGIAFIESRNKLFNLYSANQHTLDCSSEFKQLIAEMDETKKLSPIQTNYQEQVAQIFINIGEKIKTVNLGDYEGKINWDSYPFELPQYTPLELKELCEANGLELQETIYYHCHPFAPRYEKEFPVLFNTIALEMQPLGYTPLGMLMCSSLVVKIKKR